MCTPPRAPLRHHWDNRARTDSLSRPGGLPTRARPEATNGHSTDLYTSRQSTPTSIRCWPDRPAAPATSWRRSSCDSFATVYRATWLAPRLCGVTVESALPAITPHLMPPAVDRRTAPQSYWTTAVQAAASLRRRSCCCGYRRLGARAFDVHGRRQGGFHAPWRRWSQNPGQSASDTTPRRMWARLQLGAGMFYGSSAVLSVVSALRGRRATWRWNELMGPSTMRGLGVLDTVAAKPVPRRGAQRRERASKRRKFMPKTACKSYRPEHLVQAARKRNKKPKWEDGLPLLE